MVTIFATNKVNNSFIKSFHDKSIKNFENSLNKDLLKFSSLLSLILFISELFASPVANIETISFVLVSPSQETALNVFEMFFF